MKNERLYEAIGNIGDDYIRSAHAKRSKAPSVWIRWGAVAACLCLMVTVVTVLVQRMTPSSFSEFGLVVNPLGHRMSVDVDAKIEYYINDKQETVPTEEWDRLTEGFHANIGISYDAFLSLVPEYLRKDMDFYTLSTPDGSEGGAYVLHDYGFTFETDTDTNVALKMSHKGMPVRDWFFDKQENAKASDVNGTSVTIYGAEGCYVAQFVHDNVYYDITAYYMELAQLKALLTCILCAE